MANILDYLDWRGDLTLAQDPFNEVDNLILAELSFVDFGGIVPGPGEGRAVPLWKAAEAYFAKTEGRPIDMGVLVPNQIPELLRRTAASPRFRDMKLNGFVDHLDTAKAEQFAALAAECGDGTVYLSFRGTDDTLAGWKEDFYLSCMREVPAQKMAVAYTEAMAHQYPRIKLRLGGHSKGGNLAEYAALAAAPEVQGRIAHLYNHDGPGFKAGLFTATDYAPLAGRMTKQVPADSMVGILMESAMPTNVVQATGRGFEQHSVFHWVVEGADGAPGPRDAERARDAGEVRDADGMREAPRAFATLPELPERTQRRAEALDRWLASLDGSEREAMVNALFAALKAAGITDASQLFEGGREWAILRDGVMGTPAEDRTIMLNALRGLTRAFSDVTAERNSARRAEQRRAKGA